MNGVDSADAVVASADEVGADATVVGEGGPRIKTLPGPSSTGPVNGHVQATTPTVPSAANRSLNPDLYHFVSRIRPGSASVGWCPGSRRAMLTAAANLGRTY